MADERDTQSNGDGAAAAAILYEIARWRLDEQLERVKSQDNKLAATFTLNAAVIALFGAALAFADREFPYHVWGLAIGVFGVFLTNLMFAYRAYRQNEWSFRPDLHRLSDLAEAHSSDTIRHWVAREIMTSLAHNEALLRQKGRDGRVAFAAAIIDAALVGVTAIAATAPFA